MLLYILMEVVTRQLGIHIELQRRDLDYTYNAKAVVTFMVFKAIRQGAH